MSDKDESAFGDLTDDADSKKTYINQLLTEIHNKTLFIRLSQLEKNL